MVEGLLPNGWKKTALESLAVVQTGIAKGKQTSGETATLPYLRVANVQDGHVDLSVVKEITLKVGEIARYSLRTGDVLFTEGGDFDKLGRGTVWNGQIAPCLHQNHVFAVRPHPNLLSGEFLAFQASSHYGRKFFQLSSKQSTNLASINSTQLKKFPILHPSLPEQSKIAEILRTWDDALENLTALHKAADIELKALQQRLFPRDIKSCRQTLDQFASIAKHPNIETVDDQRLLTVKLHCKGIVANERGMQIVLSEKGRPYHRRNAGDLLIGRQNFHNGGFGIVPLHLDGFIASNAISSVRVDPSKLDVQYLFYFLSRSDYYLQIGHIMDGTGQKELSDKQINKLPVQIPSPQEQARIVQALNAQQRFVFLVQNEITALTRQKRGLMQKLLTGEWRVQV